MSKEAMKLALEHIEGNYTVSADEAIKALEEALAKQEQGEPVAWMDADGNVSDNNDHKCFPIPLYTTPQQRTWVGLTDEEIERLIHNFGNDPHTLLDEVDARLKGRNT
jgi:hypothetical protein